MLLLTSSHQPKRHVHRNHHAYRTSISIVRGLEMPPTNCIHRLLRQAIRKPSNLPYFGSPPRCVDHCLDNYGSLNLVLTRRFTVFREGAISTVGSADTIFLEDIDQAP